MKVICISGHAQNGKDTTAGFLKEALEADGQRVLITHYGDLVKYICKTFFGWNGQKDAYGRTLLQHVGTDIIRKQEPDFWVGFISRMLEFFGGEWDFVLIPDSRFPNEIEYLKSNGFNVTHPRVIRDGFNSPLTPEQQRHPSETALDNTVPDYCIHNNGSLQDLQRMASEWLTEFNGYHQLTFDELT